MKIALLSDIHGNHHALEAVLESVARQNISTLFVLGDVVGYYYRPDVVLRLLGDFQTTWIRGNHEVILNNLRNKTLDPEVVRKKYGSGASLALEILSSDQIDMLVQLPDLRHLEIGGVSFTLCHGSPSDPNRYVYPDTSDESLAECASFVKSDFLLMGHTHYPFVNVKNGVVLVNPGSVGQPRDQSAGASWAVIDTESKSLVFKQTPYPTSELINEINRIDPDVSFLREVLTRKPR